MDVVALGLAKSASVPRRRDRYSVLDGPQAVDRSGATATDVALQAALNAAAANVLAHRLNVFDGTTDMPVGQTVVIPDGTYKLNNALIKPPGVSIEAAPGAVLKAAASMSAVLDSDVTKLHQYDEISGGIWDCNGLATAGMYLRFFANIKVTDVTIRPNQQGLILGDPASSTHSYEPLVRGLHVARPKGQAVPAGSIGLWVQNATDGEYERGIIIGADTGVRVDSGGSTFSHYHPWSFDTATPTISFDDNGVGTTWIGCSADSATGYGFYFRQSGARVIAPRCYRNANMPDNGGTAFWFDAPTGQVTIIAPRVHGETGSSWAKDFDGPGVLFATWVGEQIANVTTKFGPANQFSASSQLLMTLQSNGGSSDLLEALFSNRSVAAKIRSSGDIVAKAAGTASALTTKTANYTATSADSIILANGAITITLPAGNSGTIDTGRRFTVRNITGSSSVTVNATSGNVDGAASATLAAGAKGTFVTDGTNWWSI